MQFKVVFALSFIVLCDLKHKRRLSPLHCPIKTVSVYCLLQKSTPSQRLPLHLSRDNNQLPAIGRKAPFSKRDEKAKERCRRLRLRNGYVPGAYKEEDAVRNKDRTLLRTKKLHQQTLSLWLEWV